MRQQTEIIAAVCLAQDRHLRKHVAEFGNARTKPANQHVLIVHMVAIRHDDENTTNPNVLSPRVHDATGSPLRRDEPLPHKRSDGGLRHANRHAEELRPFENRRKNDSRLVISRCDRFAKAVGHLPGHADPDALLYLERNTPLHGRYDIKNCPSDASGARIGFSLAPSVNVHLQRKRKARRPKCRAPRFFQPKPERITSCHPCRAGRGRHSRRLPSSRECP